MKELVIGILAHVDAGKTTLSEAILFETGRIRKLGRVDQRNTFFDTHEIERERGITIFSKQARIGLPSVNITLLDTPGHVDFSGETERTLAVLDYAILVVSGTEGVQAHTETLWNLLKRYQIPCFVFVTKMDMELSDKRAVFSDIQSRLDEKCVDFSDPTDLSERIALTDEGTLENYMASGRVEREEIVSLIGERKLFPCFFGSGLRDKGVSDLLAALSDYTREKDYSDVFSARVYKIGHDKSGVRQTFLKVTGGELKVRSLLSYPSGGEEITEKITQLRVWSGDKYEIVDSVFPGQVCSAVGLTKTVSGQGLGEEKETLPPVLEPVLNHRLLLPKECDARTILPKLRELEEEEPLLRIVWEERFGEINVQLMGPVQSEVILRLIADRCGVSASLGEGRILYRETVTEAVEGVGHFEPLRHYAEVHLLIEPGDKGSGLIFGTLADSDALPKNWQKLVLSYLEEKPHRGVLTDSLLTDVKITLLSGRVHDKHTQSIDFRESTYRALRQGLMTLCVRGACRLLEPYYAYRLELPGECVGRAITDLIARDGTCEQTETTPGNVLLTGRAPVSAIHGYASEVASYTHGKGRFSCIPDGYEPCRNEEEVILSFGYDPLSDTENTPDSVFCAHGAGFVVPWDEVGRYMHLPMSDLGKKDAGEDWLAPPVVRQNTDIDEKELEELMEKEFGPIRRKVYSEPKSRVGSSSVPKKTERPLLYVIDGYNVIYAWEELSSLAETDLEYARKQFCDILANFRAYTGREMIVVFDAYNVKNGQERKLEQNGLHIVFTKENETGDAYIERLSAEIGRDYFVRVVTSDGLVQLQSFRAGLLRISSREFHEEVIAANEEIRRFLEKLQKESRK